MVGKKRPIGVILYIVIGMLFYGFWFGLAGFGSLIMPPRNWSVWFSIVIIASFFNIIISGMNLLIKLKNWARVLFIIQMGLIGIFGLWSFHGSKEFTISNSDDVFGLFAFVIFPISCVYYLTRPKVKRQFTGAESPQQSGRDKRSEAES